MAALLPNFQNVPIAPLKSVLQGSSLSPTLAVFNSLPTRENSQMTYEFQVSSQEDFSQIVASVSDLPEGADKQGRTAWQVDRSLQPGVRYYWRARVNDGVFNSPFMVTDGFIADPEALSYPDHSACK